MKEFIWYVLTFWVGVSSGVIIAALMAAAKRGDMCSECFNKNHGNQDDQPWL